MGTSSASARIRSLASHATRRWRREANPLNRIIDIEQTGEGLTISTTDIHLPRRIGEALKRALHGELTMHFDETGYFVRVDWRAPD